MTGVHPTPDIGSNFRNGGSVAEPAIDHGKGIRRLRARSCRWGRAAFGNRNCYVPFPAANSDRRLTLSCPLRPVRFLLSGRTAETNFYELEFYEAAVGDVTLPASCRRSEQKSAQLFSVGFHHRAAVAAVGANVRSWVCTGHSRVSKRNSAVFGVNGGFSKT